ncbi:(2Fe-2S) ferredoxin domain-containing protein [Bacillus horti]|uniref:(2Fe-2S) ferredoxin n=1 Tax=Caldalkalibacillus horti TaxID=77523 RepID=A0ABT9VZU2_9BACI|nr:(2Fe-2S) ferredoxin domain-containing protein [Bacillus horti]MDQ0166503.1 (2Fe-2S) ferredoxin [Bacillus horti]
MESNQVKPKVLTEEERQKKRALSRKLMGSLQRHVLVCNGHCCSNRGAGEEVLQAFKQVVDEYDDQKTVRVTATSCLARCGDACSVVVYPEGTWYQHMKPEEVEGFVKDYLLTGSVDESHMIYSYQEGRFIEKMK